MFIDPVVGGVRASAGSLSGAGFAHTRVEYWDIVNVFLLDRSVRSTQYRCWYPSKSFLSCEESLCFLERLTTFPDGLLVAAVDIGSGVGPVESDGEYLEVSSEV